MLNYYNIPALTRYIILIRLSVLFREFLYETERKLLMNGNKVFGHKSQQTSKKKTPFWTVLHGGSSEGSQQIFLYWRAPS